MKGLAKIPKEQLLDDYVKATKIETETRSFEQKYEDIVSGNTVYGIKKAILEELGRRSLPNES